MDGAPAPSHDGGALGEVLESWEPIERYQLVAIAAAMVRWVAIERGMTEDEVLDAFIEDNWPGGR
jgi:hypothetical protein